MAQMPAEGVISAVAKKLLVEFSSVKLWFDIINAFISAVIGLLITDSFLSVGIGTVCSAVFVGPLMHIIKKLYLKLKKSLKALK